MKYVKFSKEDKAQCFDKLADHFYKANFGQMSKADIELMMFDFYLCQMIKDHKAADGSIDYNECSDYKISQDLGITQQRVRNLKIKKQLVYPVDYKWDVAFAKLIKNARYDPITQKITLNIPDPNLFIEIQNFIESRGSSVEKQLNSKILQMRAEYFIELVVSLEPEESRKKIIKNLKKQLHKSDKENAAFDSKNIGKTLINGGINLVDTAANLSTILSPGNCIGKALVDLLNAALS